MSRRISYFSLLVACIALTPGAVSAEQRYQQPGAAILDLSRGVYAVTDALPVYPYRRHDPIWKLCQVGEAQARDDANHCLRYSYYPYGRNGYRPLGTYAPYRSPPVQIAAPRAKIIMIDAKADGAAPR